MFNPGDLLVCVSNEVTNPAWKGIKPVIDNYYTWRETLKEYPDHGYVEEIRSPIDPANGSEYAHSIDWYKKIDDVVDAQALVDSISQELVTH